MEYALIKNGTVEQVIVADDSFVAQLQGWQRIERIDVAPHAGRGIGVGWGWSQGAGYTAPAQAPEPTPPADRRLAPASFKRRLTQQERIAIRQAAKVNDAVYDFMDLLNSSKFVDLDDPLTQAGLQQMEAAGLMAAGRADAVLAAPVLPTERP